MGLNTSQIISGASDFLESAEYREITQTGLNAKPNLSRLYEDPYGIVGLVAYATWSGLEDQWIEAQSWLVELLTTHTSKGDSKAWEGYLVLLTEDTPTIEEELKAQEIRQDTRRIRKLVATGNELKELSDLRRVLSPLLPLEVDSEVGDEQSALALIPPILESPTVSRRLVKSLIESYQEGEPLMDCLHAGRGEPGENS